MMVICNKHASSPGAAVSTLLYAKIMLGERVPIDHYVIIDYEYECERADTLYLDLKTAHENGFFASETLPLPDEYPAFVKEMKSVCSQCLHYSFGMPR